jgi:hypothetical protein
VFRPKTTNHVIHWMPLTPEFGVPFSHQTMEAGQTSERGGFLNFNEA